METPPLTFQEYQEQTATTAVYPHVGENLPYTVLGMVDEAGEFAEKVLEAIGDQLDTELFAYLDLAVRTGKLMGLVKKVIRDGHGQITEEAGLKLYDAARAVTVRSDGIESMSYLGTPKLLEIKPVVVPEEAKPVLEKELGDVQWYVAGSARELGGSLQEIAVQNLAKLQGRKERGTLHGSGDHR
jgi:NTP pyrophosphatase (non-canonical NTP hydrolase)